MAAEKSRVPFYIAGGVLASWAVIVSVALGLRRPDFPGGLEGQRVLIAITAVLVAATVSMAVVTSGSPAKKAEASASSGIPAGGAPPPGAPAAGAPGASTPATAAPAPSTATRATPPHGSSRKAKTGTPAAPSSPTSAAATSAVTLTANPSGLLSYDTKQLSAKAGSVTTTLANAAPVEHNVTIAEGSRVLGATPTFIGGSKAVTLTLKPGTYTFYCSVPGHRQAGMEGTLNVT
jgi:plastocyanin